MSVHDEGVIKFECIWHRADAPPSAAIASLNAWRGRAFELGLVGVTPDGIGYGNLSARIDDTLSFWVTGSATGGLRALGPEHFTRVIESDPELNRVVCEGPIRASSESMTHAVLYSLRPEIRAVIHVHSAELWRRLLGRVPTTDRGIAYGTPAMSRAVAEIVRTSDPGVIAMGGHEDGLVVYGASLDAAGDRLLAVREQTLSLAS